MCTICWLESGRDYLRLVIGVVWSESLWSDSMMGWNTPNIIHDCPSTLWHSSLHPILSQSKSNSKVPSPSKSEVKLKCQSQIKVLSLNSKQRGLGVNLFCYVNTKLISKFYSGLAVHSHIFLAQCLPMCPSQTYNLISYNFNR